MRCSVVDIRFERHLPAIYSLLRAGQDGQIAIENQIELGVWPAVDVGKSVSRVGGKAQRAVFRAVAGDLKLAYAQFEELETSARFGGRLDEDTSTWTGHP